MQNEHTPGPWKSDDEQGHEGDGGAGVFVTAASGRCVAFVWEATGHGEPTDASPEDFANARLIAAAPDMLEALREIERATEDGPLWYIANAAIAKAAGKE